MTTRRSLILVAGVCLWLFRWHASGYEGSRLIHAVGMGFAALGLLALMLVPYYSRPGAYAQYRQHVEFLYCVWTSWWLRDREGLRVPMDMFSPRELRSLKSDFELIHDSLPRSPRRFLGLPLGKEARGYGFVAYKRVRETKLEPAAPLH